MMTIEYETKLKVLSMRSSYANAQATYLWGWLVTTSIWCYKILKASFYLRAQDIGFGIENRIASLNRNFPKSYILTSFLSLETTRKESKLVLLTFSELEKLWYLSD